MTGIPITIRCSTLPRILECTASLETPDILIDTTGPEARMGNAAHEFYEKMVRENLDAPEDMYARAAEHGVADEEEELWRLAWAGVKEWKELRDHLTVVEVEQEMARLFEGFLLTGHPDALCLLSSDPKTVVIIDWKSGYRECNYTPQLKGYALLSRKRFPEAENFRIVLCFTRLGVRDIHEFTAAEIDAFEAELVALEKGAETKRYAPSTENCLYCPRKFVCPARASLLGSAGRDLIAITGEGAKREIAPADLAALYPRSRMLKKALEAYETQLREAVEAAGGEIETPDGKITLKESEVKSIEWNPDVIMRYVGEEGMASLRPTIGNGEVKAAVSAFADKRQKGKMIAACMADLEAEGSIKTTTRRALWYVKGGEKE